MDNNVIKYRRDLHKIPELDDNLPKTNSYVKNVLSKLNCSIFSLIKGSVCAFFDCGKPETTAFRADMDALPITEEVESQFKSTHNGAMHACGHDGHTAMVLALAEFINSKMPNLPNNILLIFQPSEETTGGAKRICETGILEKYNVKRVFGAHIWPDLPKGAICSRSGPMMSSSADISINLTGKSSHIAMAHNGIDALYGGAEFIVRIYDEVEKMFPSNVQRLLKFGIFNSGTANNAISAQAFIRGSLRAYDDNISEQIKLTIDDVLHSIKQKIGCDYKITINSEYLAVINDKELFEKVAAAECNIFSSFEPSMTAEDFSFYGRRVPSFFFFLGTGEKEPLHSCRFSFDDSILNSGVNFYKKLLYII